ncbi:MAG: carboxypeptidase-like regulatory domain-containing protein [Candidatus Micrarchaeia archaeon]|jgi:hypothetical protein
MGISDSLKQAYFAVEDQYYAAMDFLDQKVGVPVYNFFIDPIEKNGIPSFPFAAVLLALLVGGAYLLLVPQNVDYQVTVLDKDRNAIGGATVTAFLGDREFDTGETSDRGVVVFKNVPVGKEIYFSVEKEQFEPLTTKPLAVSLDESSYSVKLAQKPIVIPQRSLSVVVRDDEGRYVEGASVRLSDLRDAELGAQRTSGVGGTVLLFSTNESVLMVSAEKDGFVTGSKQISPSVSFTEITLSPKLVDREPQTEVAVLVRNASDDKIQGVVAAFSVYGAELVSRKTAGSGQVVFNVSRGEEFSLRVDPYDKDADRYLSYSNKSITASGTKMALRVILSRKAEGSTRNLTLTVLDEQVDAFGRNLALKAATVSLYNFADSVQIGRKPSDSDGEAEFEIGKNVMAYATAYAQGYLPRIFPTVPIMPKDAKVNVTLQKLAAGNNGPLEISVQEYDGTPAEGAKVVLFTEDGFVAGYPEQSANADGKVVFKNVSTAESFVAKASLESRSGTSGVFEVPVSDKPKKVSIRLNYATGVFVVSARDRYADVPVSPATVRAFAAGEEVGKCEIAAGAGSCELTVKSGQETNIRVAAAGFIDFESAEMSVGTDESRPFDARLLPERFNQLGIEFDGLQTPDGANAGAIDKAQEYEAVFTVTFPGNSSGASGGFYVRVGKAGKENADADSEDQKFVISGFDTLGSQPWKGTSYSKDASSCDSDSLKGDSDSGWYRWVQYYFDAKKFAGLVGSKEYRVRVYSKPSAFAGEEMKIDYRAFMVLGNNETFVRAPQDDDLGFKERVPTKDACFANTKSSRVKVQDGGLECNSQACIGISFAQGDTNYGRFMTAGVGTSFSTKFGVRLISQVRNPVIRVSSQGQQVKFFEYSVQGKALSSANANGEFDFQVPIEIEGTAVGAVVSKAVLPASPSYVYVELYDGETKVLENFGTLSIRGNGSMSVSARPRRLTAGNATDLVATVTATETGAPITEADVEIVQDDRLPFGAEGPSPSTVVGGSFDSFGQGTGGEYTFEALTAVRRGSFRVIAHAEGFSDASDTVNVTASEVLKVDPLDIEGCGAPERIALTNALDLNAQVAVTTAGCARLTDASGAQPAYAEPNYVFSLAPQAAAYPYYLTPLMWNKTCSIDVKARALDGSESYSRISYKTCGQSYASNFLQVSPPEVKNVEPNCDAAQTITLTNNGGDPSQPTSKVRVSIFAPGLDLIGGGDQNQQGNLATPIIIMMAPGESRPLTLRPNSEGRQKEIPVTITATIGTETSQTQTAQVVATFKNCPLIVCPPNTPVPEIASGRPTGTINTPYADLEVRTTYAAKACRYDSDDVPYEQMQYSLAGSGTNFKARYVPPAGREFAVGSNTIYANCQNCMGKSSDSSYTITFTYNKTAEETPADDGGIEGCVGEGCDYSGGGGGDGGETTAPVELKGEGAACTKNEECQSGLVCVDAKCAKPTPPALAGTDNTITFTINADNIAITQAGKPITETTLGVSSIIPRTAVKIIVENKAGAKVSGIDASGGLGDCFDVTPVDSATTAKAFDLEKDAKKSLLFSFASPASDKTRPNYASCVEYKLDTGTNHLSFATKIAETALAIRPLDNKYNNAPSLKIKLVTADTDAFTIVRAPFDTHKEEFVANARNLTLTAAAKTAIVNVVQKIDTAVDSAFGGTPANPSAIAASVDAAAANMPAASLPEKLAVFFASNVLVTDIAPKVHGGSQKACDTGNNCKLSAGEYSKIIESTLGAMKGLPENWVVGRNDYKIDLKYSTDAGEESFGDFDYKNVSLSSALVMSKAAEEARLGLSTRLQARQRLQAALDSIKSLKASEKEEDLVSPLGISRRPIIVATVEGNATRILQFQIGDDFNIIGDDKDASGGAVETTSNYEYWTTKGVIPASYAPPLVQFGAPGQKRHTAYSDSTDCRGSDPDRNGFVSFFAVDHPDAAACIGRTSGADEDYRNDELNAGMFKDLCKGTGNALHQKNCVNAKQGVASNLMKYDAYCNYASGKLENNPRLCCQSGISKDGVCIDAANRKEGGKLKDQCFILSSGHVAFVPNGANAQDPKAKQPRLVETGKVLEQIGADTGLPKKEALDALGDACKGLSGDEESACQQCFIPKPCDKNACYQNNMDSDQRQFKPVQLLSVASRCYGLDGNNEDCTTCGIGAMASGGGIREKCAAECGEFGAESEGIVACTECKAGVLGGMGLGTAIGTAILPGLGSVIGYVWNKPEAGLCHDLALDDDGDQGAENARKTCTPMGKGINGDSGYSRSATVEITKKDGSKDSVACNEGPTKWALEVDKSLCRPDGALTKGGTILAKIAMGRPVSVDNLLTSSTPPVIDEGFDFKRLESCDTVKSVLKNCFKFTDAAIDAYGFGWGNYLQPKVCDECGGLEEGACKLSKGCAWDGKASSCNAKPAQGTYESTYVDGRLVSVLAPMAPPAPAQ